MAKEKRKGRLDKKGSSEFIGFSSFASESSSSPSASTSSGTWSPVYMGNDDNLQLLFPRINPKRDATTKTKALQDLGSFLGDSAADRSSYTEERTLRKAQVEALQHYAWQYYHKVHYEPSPAVRAAALQVWSAAAKRIPKAVWNLTSSVQPELLGMWFAAQADPATAVQNAAQQLVESVRGIQSSNSNDDNDGSSDVWKDSLVNRYASRLLGYGRAGALHQAIFNVTKSSSFSTETNKSAVYWNSEDEKDAAEERFERIVGTCLDALNVWLQQATNDDAASLTDITLWWKTLQHTRPSLRLKTYYLLSTACTRQVAALPNTTMTNQLVACISSEKQVTNLPSLLETVMAYLSLKHKSSDTNQLIQKPLLKVLKKACYGAPVSLWGPTLLPLVALLKSPQIITAAWQGRDLTVGSVIPLATAVAESCLFWVQTRIKAMDPPTLNDEVLLLWLEPLQLYLAPAKTNKTKNTEPLRKQLVKDLQQLLAIEDNMDWFWKDAFSLQDADPTALSTLLRDLSPQAELTRILPQIQSHFCQVLSLSQGSSGSIPSDAAYELFSTVLSRFGPRPVLQDGLEKFVMNDLMRWMILHTTVLSAQHEQTEWLVQQDFHLLDICLGDSNIESSRLWDSIVRELVAAKCDLHFIVVGIKTLSTTVPWVPCAALTQFAEEEAVACCSTDSRDGDTLYEKRLELFKLCAGLSSKLGPLVEQDVISQWEENAGSTTVETALLEVLLELIESNSSTVTDARRLVLHTWSLGGSLYSRFVPTLLSREIDISWFLSQSSHDLTDELSALSERDRSIQGWSARAIRFLEVRKMSTSPLAPKLGLFDDLLNVESKWEMCPGTLFACTMELFHSMDSPADRLSLLREEMPANISLCLVRLLLMVADGRTIESLMKSSLVQEESKSQTILDALGGRDIDRDLLSDAIKLAVTDLKEHLSKNTTHSEETIANYIVVLSELVGSMFLPLFSLDVPKPEEVKEGKSIWYITDPNDPLTREPALVTKVHYDAQTGYFFSILLNRTDGKQERQTVIDRLRTERMPGAMPLGIYEDAIPEAENLERKQVCQLIWTDLVKRFAKPESVDLATPLMGELISLLGGSVSLGKERGLGSCHYDVFQLITAFDSKVFETLKRGDFSRAAPVLWTSGLALGFGLNTSCQRWSLGRIRLNMNPSCNALLEAVENKEAELLDGDQCAVLAWLTVVLEHLCLDSEEDKTSERSKTALRTVCLLFQLSANALSHAPISQTSLFSCKAISEGTRLLPGLKAVTATGSEELIIQAENLQLDSLFQLVSRVVNSEESSLGSDTPLSALNRVFDAAKSDAALRTKLGTACRSSNTGGLVTSLFDPQKRFLSFCLLELVAEKNSPLQPTDAEVELGQETTARLASWLQGLDEDEAAETEEDVYIVAEWIPKTMMAEIETWHTMDLDPMTNSEIKGQFLSWLSLLRFIDAAAPVDFRNRPAFISYLAKCGALSHILSLALLNEKTLNEKKRSSVPSALLTEDLISKSSNDFDLSELASVTLFRTIEVLPALSRRWWEEDCPKAYISAMQDFVEKHVGPKILQRELARIKQATAVFGSMNVNASSVSRQVSADYVQDDFTLKVHITIPPAFPFRSAEVDCSKTLGVPQSRWKRWSLQIMMMLNNQGGTLQDALILWKDNVDKEFEGVEPCPVCYSVLHVKTHKLPSLECKTCNNRFHVDCLTQWFKSSGKNQCVLCQQPWQGTRV